MGQQETVGEMRRQRAHRGQALYYGWVVVGASFVIVMLSTSVRMSFGNFLQPMSIEFGWDRATVSLPAAVAMLMNGVFQPFVGRLIDRLGPRLVIALGLCLLAVSTAATAATTTLGYLIGVYGLLVALGLSGAGSVPNTTLVVRWFERQRGQAMGIVNAGGAVSQLLLVPALMVLIVWTEWRTAYAVLGGIVLCLGVPIAILLVRNAPQDLGLLPDGVLASPVETHGAAQGAPAVRKAPLEPVHWHAALASGPLWLLNSGFFVCGFSLAIISTHFVAFATDRGTSPAVLVTALGILGGFNVVGTCLAGTVSDRLGRKNPLTVIYLLRAAAFAMLLASDAPWALYLFAALAGLSWFGTAPLTMSLTAELYGVTHMGTLAGVVFMSHQLRSAIGIYLAGKLYDLSGSYTAIYLMGILLLLGASLASYVIQERRYSTKYVATAQARAE